MGAMNSDHGSMPALVICDEVSRTFGRGSNAIVAVHSATCLVIEGAQIVITGPSGSGKSTLLHLLAGLDRPTTGAVEWPGIGGLDSLRPGPVGMVFQGPSLISSLTVLENVALPALLAGGTRDDSTAMARRALERLELNALATKLPEEISGGQAQRVAVARALAGEPRLILADEPTGQLDRASATQVVRALREAARASGAALLITTHDPLVAERFEDDWTMKDGRLDTQEVATCSA